MEFLTLWYQTSSNLSARLLATGVTNLRLICKILDNKNAFHHFESIDICEINKCWTEQILKWSMKWQIEKKAQSLPYFHGRLCPIEHEHLDIFFHAVPFVFECTFDVQLRRYWTWIFVSSIHQLLISFYGDLYSMTQKICPSSTAPACRLACR